MNAHRNGQETQSDLLQRSAQVFPGGVLARHRLPEDLAIVFSHGRRGHIFDASGAEYIDFTCGGGSLLLGYDCPEISASVSKQMERASHFLSLTNIPAIEFADALIEIIPCGDQIRFCSSGAEGTFMALRLARAFTGKEKILKFEGAYHGNHDYAMWNYLSRVTSDNPSPTPDSLGIPTCISETILIAPFNDLANTKRIIEGSKGSLAAIIVEPTQRLIAPDRSFLSGLRELADEHQIVLIFDETVTGFRLALGGAQEKFGIVPDLAVYGKTLGGGLPLAAVAGRHSIMSLCDPRKKDNDSRAVYFSGTGFGNPVACAAGNAMLNKLKEPNVYPPFIDLCERLKDGLRDIIDKRAINAKVVGFGPMWHLIFVDDCAPGHQPSAGGDREKLLKLHYRMIDAGIFVRPGGGHYFSFAHTEEDVNRTLDVIDSLITKL